mgnify:CR=1 FL=1
MHGICLFAHEGVHGTIHKNTWINNFIGSVGLSDDYIPEIYKTEIARNLGKPNWKPESKDPFIKPDGGVLYARIDGYMYPILVSEAKQQGTNDIRQEEGKKKNAVPLLGL